jgi:ABC-type polysaccharide/polyol phosphate export permease
MTDMSAWKEVFRLGWIMGYQDYKMANAGSRLGRYWPTIGMAIRIAFIGTIFSVLFNSSRGDYLPWLASGWIVWGFISSAFQGSANAYISSKAMMLSLPLDKRSFVAKVIIKEGLSLLKNLHLSRKWFVLFHFCVSYGNRIDAGAFIGPISGYRAIHQLHIGSYVFRVADYVEATGSR